MKLETTPRIRRATHGDVMVMSNLLGQLFKIEKNFHSDIHKHEKGLSLLLSRWEDAVVLVAEYNQKVVGMVTAQVLISTVEGDKVALLEDLVVDEKFRKLGIGKMLIDAMEETIAKKGLKRMQLLADIQNLPAHKFYNKYGWNETPMKCWRKYPHLTTPD